MAPKQTASAAKRARLVPLTLIQRAQQCVAYGRVSTELQREAQSINVQKNLLVNNITAQDNPDLPVADQRKLVAQFWDDGVSGTIPLEDRPEGRRLVGLICNRGSIHCEGDCGSTAVVDAVWATKLDRLARRLQVLIAIEAFLRHHGVALRVLEFNIDTSTPMGKMIFTILGAINEWEREVILERTHSGRKQKVVEGKFVGGRRTMGLKVDADGHFVVDDELVGKTGEMAYRIVQQIFENVALHGSTAGREAQRFGFTERRVGWILHNPRYKGEGGMLSGGEWIAARDHTPPALVSPELWDLAQTALKDNRKFSSRNRQHDYLVPQLLFCHEPRGESFCGRMFQGRVTTRARKNPRYATKQYVYYYCTRRDGCTARPLSAHVVEAAVWKEVARALRNPKDYLAEALARGNQDDLVRELRNELTVIIDQLAKHETERLSVLRNADKGHYTEAESDARIAEIRTNIEGLKTRQAALELQLRSVTLSHIGLQRAGIVSADINEQLDRIEALCQSADPNEAHTGAERKAAIIKSVVERGEVRTGPKGESRIRLHMRFSESTLSLKAEDNRQKVVVEPRYSAETDDNAHRDALSVVVDVALPERAA